MWGERGGPVGRASPESRAASVPRTISTHLDAALNLAASTGTAKTGKFFRFPTLLIHPVVLVIRVGREVPVGVMKILGTERLQERVSETLLWVYLSLGTP